VEPGSTDGFYPSDSNVQVTAVANEGFRFRRWEGDLAGTSAGGFLSMQVPRVVRAQLDKVPFIPSAGIRNAAGETPLKAVAPGSIISIFGSGLANDYVAGGAGPLTQTLGNVTARIGTRLLPLLFVSPEQVNAYLPSDLADGEYSLGVRNGAQPELAGKVTVVRNAPGLFGQHINDQFVATAQRPDGSLAAPDKPARRNAAGAMPCGVPAASPASVRCWASASWPAMSTPLRRTRRLRAQRRTGPPGRPSAAG
jgi:uncharacterized protein (TIGR03437 family)